MRLGAWPGFLVILEPPVLEDRMKNQGSLFAIYVTMGEYELVWDHGDYIRRVEATHSTELMTKLTIPKAVKQELQREIHRAGFTPYLIFPDLTGLAMLLTQ